jgi:hypothetical protein
MDRDRNSAWNLHPDRYGAPTGGAGSVGAVVPVGDDGTKTEDPTGVLAA